jgi:hypothetical protein
LLTGGRGPWAVATGIGLRFLLAIVFIGLVASVLELGGSEEVNVPGGIVDNRRGRVPVKVKIGEEESLAVITEITITSGRAVLQAEPNKGANAGHEVVPAAIWEGRNDEVVEAIGSEAE